MRVRVRRAAKPQSGRIRHQKDCLVETSNFSSPTAWVPNPSPSQCFSAFLAHSREGSRNRNIPSLRPHPNPWEEHWPVGEKTELVRTGELCCIEDSEFLITMTTRSHPQHSQQWKSRDSPVCAPQCPETPRYFHCCPWLSRENYRINLT